MRLKTLRKGSKGQLVGRWQTFLEGADYDPGPVDNWFGGKTEIATRAFQRKHGLDVDGVAGNNTLGKAMTLGWELVPSQGAGELSPNWPPRTIKPLGWLAKRRHFGTFDYVASPTKSNPEAITILGDWRQKNIVVANVPQLDQVQYAPGKFGMPGDEKFACHRIVREPIQELFREWEREGLLPLVKTWGGCWNPRFIRGSRKTLSNHAYGTAFDINVPWNGLGRRPALVGETGSVRELVPIAAKLGWYWGGWYEKRKDGMHFEYVGTEL